MADKGFDEWFAGLPTRESDGGTSLLFLNKREEKDDSSAIERAVVALTDTVKALVQRQDQPAPAPNVTVEVYPQIDVQAPDVKIDFPEHEQVMVVERDEEGFIQTIRKRFVRGGEAQPAGSGVVQSIGQMVRQGLGLGPKDES